VTRPTVRVAANPITPRPTNRIKKSVSAADRQTVLSADACHYCGDVLLPREVEHQVPSSRGGTNDLENLVAACVSCNSQKGPQLVHEWRSFRQTHGMPWPPLASHPTEPTHYRDRCYECDMTHDRRTSGGAEPEHRFIAAPHDLVFDGGAGYTGRYRCPAGHRWSCWYSIDQGYFSDCPCAYCWNHREDNGDRHWPAMPLYADLEWVKESALL
jgi:hypothetical protein